MGEFCIWACPGYIQTCHTIFVSVPTICYEGMEHTEVTPVTSRNGVPETPTLFEVSPSAMDETIVDVIVKGDDKPAILYPSKVLDNVRFNINTLKLNETFFC